MIDLRRLTLEQIRAFVAVAEHQSFTNAARSRMRTQTALTRQIRSMEDALGERLLKRSRGHVEGLTDAGQRLLPFALKILATVDDAWTSLQRPSVSGRIRVGIMDDIDVGWLNELVSRFRTSHPDCDVRAVSDFSARLERRLENREIDIAIIKQLVPVEAVPSAGVLRREALVWAAGPGFRPDPERLLPLVVFHEGCAYRRHLLEILEAKGIRSQVVYEGQSYANVLAAVRAGFGITALAESQVEAGGLLRLQRLGDVDLAELGTVEIVLRQAAGRSNAALKAFARAIELHMPEGAAAAVSGFPASASPFLVPAGVGRPAPGGQSLAR